MFSLLATLNPVFGQDQCGEIHETGCLDETPTFHGRKKAFHGHDKNQDLDDQSASLGFMNSLQGWSCFSLHKLQLSQTLHLFKKKCLRRPH